MKIKLTREQTGKLVETWRRTHGIWESLEAVLMAYEEMRPKDAAPVMWRRTDFDKEKTLNAIGEALAAIQKAEGKLPMNLALELQGAHDHLLNAKDWIRIYGNITK